MKIIRSAKWWIGLLIITAGIFPVKSSRGADPNTSKTSDQPVVQSQAASKPQTGDSIDKAAPSPSSFKPDMPFEQAINILRNSTSPPITIAVLWKDIERNAGINRNTPIGIDGVSKVPLRTHLKLLLSALSAGSEAKLGYVIDDGVIMIATEKSLPGRLRTRIYYIADLVAR